MARFTATEMVGVPLTSVEVQRLLAALDAGALGDPAAADNTLLRQKLTVLLQVEPEIVAPCLRYVHDAIAKYWSEGVFELIVNVGCASARKL